jgi:hypothetical protein
MKLPLLWLLISALSTHGTLSAGNNKNAVIKSFPARALVSGNATEKDGSNGAVTITLVICSMVVFILAVNYMANIRAFLVSIHESGYCDWIGCYSLSDAKNDLTAAYNSWKKERKYRSAVVAISGPFPLLETEGYSGECTSDITLIPTNMSEGTDSIPVASRIDRFVPKAPTAPVVATLMRQHAVPVNDD